MKVYHFIGILLLIVSSKAEVEGGGDSGDSSSAGDSSMSAAVGAITGVVCGFYGIYVVVGSASVLIIYWLPSLTTGLLSYEIVFVSVGVVVSVAVFPIGLVLLIAACCCSQGNGPGRKWNYRPSPISTILCYIGVVTSIMIFPLGIAALVLYCLQSKVKAQGVLISAGIVGSVVVFPMGLALLLAFCFCPYGKKSEKHSHKKFNNSPDWVDALFYIGAVASGIILPLGISILIYDYCKEGRRVPDWLKFLLCIGAMTSGIVFPLGLSILICYSYKKEDQDVEEIYYNPVDPTIYDTPADPVIYETVGDPPLFRRFEPDTSGNIAYGVLQGVPTTSNPAYGQVRR